jgi:HK97 gp10 family phage protein
MITRGKFYLKGINEFERQTNKLIKEVHEGETKILGDQAKIVQQAIKENAPMGPKKKKPSQEKKRIKESTYSITYPPKLNSPAVAFIGIRPRKAPHTHLVSSGHGGPQPAPPHPFVVPIFEGMKEQTYKNIENEIKKTIEEAV